MVLFFANLVVLTGPLFFTGSNMDKNLHISYKSWLHLDILHTALPFHIYQVWHQLGGGYKVGQGVRQRADGTGRGG